MIESHDLFDPVHEVEAMIRAAGNYVQPSEDLRPRVIEVVRSQRVESTIRWRICQVAALLIVLNILATSTLHNVELADGGRRPAARAHEQSQPSGVYGDVEAWDTVDGFREVRRRQAYLLRLHL